MERSGPLGRLCQSWGIVVNKIGGQYRQYVLRKQLLFFNLVIIISIV